MEITISTIIKLIIGLVVIAAVVYGLYLVFNNQIKGGLGGIGIEEGTNFILGILK